MRIKYLHAATLLLLISLFAGCTSVPVVQPTKEELAAARKVKKTVAIIDFDDKGSPIADIQSEALPKLEKYLMGHFNMVERTKIDAILKERHFTDFDDVERMNKLGQLLGADYLVFGNVIASISSPEIKQQSHEYKSGRFFGRIWEEYKAESEISLKFVAVSNGTIVYSDKQRGWRWGRGNEQSYRHKNSFKRALREMRHIQNITDIIGAYKGLHKEYATAVSYAIDGAIRKFNEDLSYKFPQQGQVIKILSANDILVNLGSAYGLKPGDRLVVYQNQSFFKDPKTGVVTVLKEEKAILKVTRITSGLSCIATGDANAISTIRSGDIVYTYR